MDSLPELDQPRPEDPHFLQEEERFSLLFMLAMDEERQQTDAPLTMQQEFRFLMQFLASPPEELRTAMRDHIRLMIAHVAGFLAQEHVDGIADGYDYELFRKRICEAVLGNLRATPIQSLDDLQHSSAWHNAYIDLLEHVGGEQGGNSI